MYHLKPAANSWLVFDNSYTVYQQFAKWTAQQLRFVTSMKENADFHLTKVLMDKIRKKMPKGD